MTCTAGWYSSPTTTESMCTTPILALCTVATMLRRGLEEVWDSSTLVFHLWLLEKAVWNGLCPIVLRIMHTSRLNAKRLLTSSSCRCQFVAALDLQWFPLNPKVGSKETVGSELQRHWTLEKSEITQQLFPCQMGGIWIWLLFFYCAGSHLPMSACAKHE